MSNEMMNTTVSEGYELTRNEEGKFKRRAVYHAWSSVKPETREQKIAMMNLLNSGDEANALSDFIGVEIKIADVIFNPYDSVDEDTGELTNGVLTYILTPEGVPYVTSSKSVYFTLKNMFKAFGEPHYNEDEAVTVQAVKKKGLQFQYIDLKIIG